MLRVLEFDDGARLIVEADDNDAFCFAHGEALDHRLSRDQLPDGVEAISAASSIRKAGTLLEEQIAGLAALARTAAKSIRPSQIQIEAHVKFAGGAEVIPFLVSAKGEGGLKLTLTWLPDTAGDVESAHEKTP